MGLASGTRLGPYEIRSALGAGGMGEVYRACDTRLGRDVAIKILPESFARDSDRLHRFELEARAVAALKFHFYCSRLSSRAREGSRASSPARETRVEGSWF